MSSVLRNIEAYDLATLVFRLRVDNNLKQKHMGRILGVSTATAACIENNTRTLKAIDIAKLCAHFNLDANEVLGLTGST
jgi:DNA-binding XRE family transcriptional regulator